MPTLDDVKRLQSAVTNPRGVKYSVVEANSMLKIQHDWFEYIADDDNNKTDSPATSPSHEETEETEVSSSTALTLTDNTDDADNADDANDADDQPHKSQSGMYTYIHHITPHLITSL
ncbi:hypothetical protein BKA93DRAFT_824103 [Sparassis latifolia]